MTLPATPATLPPLLKKFHDYRPGDIHTVAAKVHLMAGFEACKANTLTDAVWNEDKTALIVSFIGGSQTTLLVEGCRLLAKCTCNQWQPARNCPHVVMAWATLKRLVSPEALTHIRFNQQLLLDMKRYTDREPTPKTIAATDESPTQGKLREKLWEARRVRNEHLNSAAVQASRQFRLVIEHSRHRNGLSGRFMRGDDVIHGWTSIGIPTDLARFMATHYYYESTPQYFETFLSQTNGKYPVVFRDSEAHETPLTYSTDTARQATITFDIQGDEVIISRSLDKGAPIPSEAIVHGHLLFAPDEGAIFPITNREAWKNWDAVIDELDSVHDFCEFGEFDEAGNIEDIDDEDNSDPDIITLELRRLPHAVAAPRSLFNSSCIRLSPDMFATTDEYGMFFYNKKPVAKPNPGSPTYLLDIPDGVAQPTVSIVPVGLYNGQTFPCSNAVFWLLNPLRRSSLSASMRTKKRLRAVLKAAFALMDEPKTTARNAIIRSVTATPDFSKRKVKSEAKQLLNHFAKEWNQKMVLLLATPDGWQCVEDDRRYQVRLLKMLFQMFGLESFGNSFDPGAIELSTELFLRELPHLMSCLQSEGFSLRLGAEPLTTASWEFSLDATSSTIDWFELRPEIRCDGELLSDEELQGLMAGNSMLRRKGRLIMMDETSAQVLAMIAGAMPSGKRKRKDEQELVRVPRLQILDWLQLRSRGVEVKLSTDDARVLESLLDFERIPERPLPVELNATLRHYQVDAYRWLGFLYEHRFGACLADDMGLGKTIQGIALLAGIAHGTITSSAPTGTPHLIVVPPSLLFNWEAEIARFLPGSKVLLYVGSGRSVNAFTDYDIVITSYGIVHRDIEMLETLRFNVIIFDETQVVKNLQAATTNAVRRLNGTFSLGLTGTPVENHLGEYYAIMDLCLPGLLGSREEFTRQTGQRGQAGIERLIRRTRPFVLRRSKQMISAELPPKIETDIHLDLSPKQKVLYQRTVEEVRGQVRDAFANHAPGQARIIALTAILRLRQICLAPVLAAPGATDASPKLEFLAEQLTELRDEGHSALVFSQFTGYLDIIEQGLKQHSLPCLRLDGSTPVPQRKNLVQKFQHSDEPTVFLISLKAGGKGLNLTKATYVFHMDPWWNPAVENQASDRAHRIGQTNQVTITRLIMRHTIEEKMMALKERKLQLYKAILEENASGGGAGLSREDFEFLLGS